ncbi:uncharacterized protein ELE39_001304 [Cryptosporidium sp. chipmunk genotype I]|uniref:uncharacterized protein n=1 Tax=Cryptosporidium sp. chipmunk genotype I TaxID=1280935 RepID=UPI00351A4B97|nr:hypothetical protein ELE39_001304 [Cryptosporidium sp. chipmunk genotype I]
MNLDEPVELVSHIKAIFHFLGGICMENTDEGTDISIMKVSLEDSKASKDDSVSLELIEERINSIQGTDPKLKLMISKMLPKLLSKCIHEQGRLHENGKVVYFSFSEFIDSLREECNLLELE